MRQLSGAPRGDGDMGKVIKGINDRIDILARRIARQDKASPITSTVGARRAYSGGMDATSSGLHVKGWTFDDALSWPGSNVPDLVPPSSDPYRFHVADAGWYCIKVYGGISFSSPPADGWVTWVVNENPATSANSYDTGYFEQERRIVSSSVTINLGSSPFYIHATSPEGGALQVSAYWSGSATATSADITYDVIRVG